MIAIDPGLDCTGLARFRMSVTPPRTLNAAVELLDSTGKISTQPGATIERRLGIIAHEISQLDGAQLIVVEVPPYDGPYTGDRRRQSGVTRLYMAIGAILGGAACREPTSLTTMHDPDSGRVVTVPVITEAKSFRNGLLKAAGCELPAGPRGGIEQDKADAIWIGCQWMLNPPALMPQTTKASP